MKSLNLGVNVLAVLRELIGDVDQLARDDPADAASRRHRHQDGRENGPHAAGVPPLEKRRHRSQ